MPLDQKYSQLGLRARLETLNSDRKPITAFAFLLRCSLKMLPLYYACLLSGLIFG